MDEQKKYTSYTIPRRDVSDTRKPAATPKTDAAAETLFHSAKFVEIEIESSANHESTAEKALKFFSSVTQPIPIEQRTHDPLRLKFFDMRRLATDKPFARDDSELFYKQAKFMEDFTDDYEGDARFFIYYPYYQHMGYEQLRTYFTWRTKIRTGDIQPTSGSYVFLYVYELLNNIGVENPADGLDKLLAVWKTCMEFAPALENYLPEWFKDYHIYYELPRTFADFVKTHNMYKHYSASFLLSAEPNDSLELWNSVSIYNINKSQFYNDGNEQLFKDCFNAVLDGICELCKSSKTSLEELFIYSISKRMPWRPFKRALFHHWLHQDDRSIELPGQERYYCKNNLWSTNLPMYYSTQKEFVGYIIKKTEACLRQAVDYRYKLKTEPDIRYHEYFQELKELDGRRAGLDNAIEKAVAAFHRNRTRTVVTVDHENLSRIRREALGTQEKLTVPEDMGDFGIRNPKFGMENAPLARADDLGTLPVGHGIPDAPLARADDDDGWVALIEALNPLELKALSLILSNDSNIKAFADENGIMLEVLADSINEKAADFIGDSILETGDGMTIYDEYKDIIAQMVKGS